MGEGSTLEHDVQDEVSSPWLHRGTRKPQAIAMPVHPHGKRGVRNPRSSQTMMARKGNETRGSASGNQGNYLGMPHEHGTEMRVPRALALYTALHGFIRMLLLATQLWQAEGQSYNVK